MRIIYKDSEGLKIIIPSPHYQGTIVALATKRIPKGCEYKIVSDKEILSDREFRDAWDYDFSNDDPIKIDFEKAKEIWKNKLRAERKPLLEALDVEVIKNITDADKIAEIEAQKQPLRDITLLVDECKTLDQIREVAI